TKVGDTLLLDSRASGKGDGAIEASVAWKQKLEEECHQKIFGYARFDIIEHKDEIRFGSWNDRPLQQNQVSRLVQSFLTKGANRFAITKAIPLVVKKTEVKENTYATSYPSSGNAIETLPLLELRREAVGKKRLAAAGGQHRLRALEEWTKILQKRHTELTKQRQIIEQKDSEMVTATEIEQENQQRKPKRDALQQTLAFGGQWLVVLYDAETKLTLCHFVDQINIELGLHLSQNESEHVYRETPEEALLHQFRTMQAKKETYLDVEQIDGVTGAPRKRAELLAQDYFWEFMERVESMGIHMFNGKSTMKMNCLHDTMLGPNGGILCYMVARLEENTCMCFNEVAVEEARIDELITMTKGKSTSKSKSARTELLGIWREMRAASTEMPGAKGAVYAIRECMDAAFEEHLGPRSDAELVFANHNSHRWKNGMMDYLNELITQIPKLIETITSGIMESDNDEDLHVAQCLRFCVAKIKILLWLVDTDMGERALLINPFMSRTVYDHMVKRMEVITEALLEFCRWWEPMIDMVPIIGKYWCPGSASAAMVRSILCHRDIVENKRTAAVKRIVYMVWNDYASFVNMHIQLQEHSIPKRITVQKTLLSIFGINQGGASTKELCLANIAIKELRGTTGERKKATTTSQKDKGKQKAGAKGKGRSKSKQRKGYEDEEDEDDEADNEDEDDDKGSDLVDSDEQSETDSRIEEKRERARDRHEMTMNKHRALISKNMEWSEINTKIYSSKEDGRQKTKIPLDFSRSPPNWTEPWKKVSRVAKDCQMMGIRGLSLVDWTAWEWKNLPHQVFTRVIRNFSAAAIAESSTIISYRPEMILCNPLGGAATLRLRKDPAQTSQMHQTTLKDILGSASQDAKTTAEVVLTEGRLPPKGSITWPDGIYLVLPEGYATALHVVEIELQRLQEETALVAQEREVQKALNVFQNLRVTWHDATNRVHAHDNPRLDDDVAESLNNLLQALNQNAYRQRNKATRTSDFDPSEAMKPGQRLRVKIRSDELAEQDLDDRFFMGASHTNNLQDVMSKGESVWHLQELSKKYSMWHATQSKRAEEVKSKFKFEKGAYIEEDTKKDVGTDTSGSDEEQAMSDDADACLSTNTNECPPPSEVMDDECHDAMNAGPSLSMFDNLPVTADGEFISQGRSLPASPTYDTGKGEYDYLYEHMPYRTFHDPSEMRVLVPNTPEVKRYAHTVLDGVEEDHEDQDDSSDLGNIADAMKKYTILADDTDTDPTIHRSVATKLVLSPERAHALQKSRKRDRATTISSTGSKDGQAVARPSQNPSSTKSTSEFLSTSTIHP
ncbi:hypothetical protein EV363DRAFT_1102171, partial [Boletus edulis]